MHQERLMTTLDCCRRWPLSTARYGRPYGRYQLYRYQD